MKRLAGSAGARGLGSFQVQIYDDRILTASYHHRFARFVDPGVDFLVRHIRRHVNEISRTGFLAEFQSIAPPHARAAAHDVEDRFEFAVMVRSGLGIGIYDDRTGPQFASACARVRDGRFPGHARSLGSVRVERADSDDFDSLLFPIHASILAFGGADDHKRIVRFQESGDFEAPVGEPNGKLASGKSCTRRIPQSHFYEERVRRQLESLGR